jgi:hypothetical protein
MAKKLVAAIGPATTPQSLGILDKLRHGLTTAIETLQKFLVKVRLRGSQLIVSPESLPSSNDQIGLTKIRQMLGNGGLRQVKHIDQTAHAQFTTPQQMKNAEPSGV